MVKLAVHQGINPSQIRILTLLSEFRFAPTSIIRENCFPEQTYASGQAWVSRQMSALRQKGLTDYDIAFGREYAHFLTANGAELMGVEGSGRGVKLAEYHHDLALLHLCLALRNAHGRADLITERTCRSSETNPEDNPYAIPITRDSGKLGHAWPDLVSGHIGELTGYEVEWSTKNRRRLTRLMHSYGYATNYRIGIYFTTSATHALVSECAEETNAQLHRRGMGRPIAVRRLEDFIDLEKVLK